MPGWRPVVGGVRHIDGTAHEPTSGSTAEMLCGRLFTLPRRRQRTSPLLFDCSACWHVWLGID